jgi:nuclear pore complex protein Nup121
MCMGVKISCLQNLVFHYRSEQILDTTLSSPSSNAPDPCAKETVLNALKEKKKRTVAEEDQLHLDGQENKRR